MNRKMVIATVNFQSCQKTTYTRLFQKLHTLLDCLETDVTHVTFSNTIGLVFDKIFRLQSGK